MNQSCPQCNNDGGFCNFCGNKPKNAITGEILQKAGEFANEEQRKIFYKDQDPYKGKHKCTGTGVCGYCKPNGFNGTAGEVGSTPDQDPYEAQGSNLRVHHPTQPKTQVERWEEEFDRNVKEIFDCCGYVFNAESGKFEVRNSGENCPKTGTDRCGERHNKNKEIGGFISQATQPIHPRYPTGGFVDDIENAPEYIKKSLFGYNFKKVTLLDEIKKLLWKRK